MDNIFSNKKLVKTQQTSTNNADLEEEKIAKSIAEVLCVICMENVKPEIIASLDHCTHKYCGPCILKWVEDSENKCPACKAKITKISYLTVTGEITSVAIENKE